MGTKARSVIGFASVLFAASLLLSGGRAMAWGNSTPPYDRTTPEFPNDLGTHQWLIWRAIDYMAQRGHPAAESLRKYFERLALGNWYADNDCRNYLIPEDNMGVECWVWHAGTTDRYCCEGIMHFPGSGSFDILDDTDLAMEVIHAQMGSRDFGPIHR